MIKYIKPINILVLFIIVLSLIACFAGLFSTGGSGQYSFQAITGETVEIYGSGLYQNDSISVVAQGKAGDLVTLVMGIPLLLISLYLTNKRAPRGRLMLTGTLGYFLYTYMSYTFLWHYNAFFIVYVILMSLSLYAFVLSMMSFEIEKIPDMFNEKMPIKFLAGFQLFVGLGIGMLWLGKIAPSIFEGAVPIGLEHYTALVIQGMDLGFIVPTAILSAVLLLQKKPMGYLLTSVIIIKGFTMLTALSAMIINMALKGVEMNIVELSMFPLFNLLAVIGFMLMMKSVKPSREWLNELDTQRIVGN